MARWEPRVRWAAGTIFVLAGIVKFAFHAGEVHAFTRYGLPAPSAFVDLIGVVELVGGVLLIRGLLTRPVALVLAAVMVGAIVVAGLGQGEAIPSLTLAPALLVAMLFLLWASPRGRPAAADRLRRRPAPR